MNREKVAEMYKRYNLTKDDVFQHKHYLIITRSGISKISALEDIKIKYDAITSTPEFCVVKATAIKGEEQIETFGSAKYGKKTWNAETKKYTETGNTSSWYIMEMAEKRAFARAVLQICNLYELGIYGEDESEEFKKTNK